MATKRIPAFDPPSDLVTQVRLCASGASVTVRGEIDVHTAPVLRDRLSEVVRQGEQRIAVHLDEVTFMDSTGLGVLVGAHKAQQARGSVLELVCSEPRLLRLIELTGLDRVFTIHAGLPGPST
jgi:anti-sigma B factor antagonist